VTGFVDVLLRSLILAAQAAAVGGVVFALWTLRASPAPLGRTPSAPLGRGPDLERAWTLVAAGAGTLVIAQSLSALTQVIALDGTARLGDLVATSYFRVSAARVLAALVLLAGAWRLRRASPMPAEGARATVIAAAAALVLLAPWTSHAAARPGSRFTLLILDGVHQVAAWIWIGGLAQLVVVAARGRDETWPPSLLQRFSNVALVSVSALVLAGGALSWRYIDGPRALLGTAYGVMVLTKAVLLITLLVLGALNFFVVRRLVRGVPAPLRLRRFVEVELGLGLTVLGAAASLTSLPPAVDVIADRATFAEVGHQFTPRWPTFSSPELSELPVDDRNAPRTDADRAWSEYNHHWSGLFVLSMGLLALLHQTGRARWARHWPLIFLVLAVFLFFRSDPGSWPIGPYGFWESMLFPEVLQHRLFLMIIVVFGIFEWRVRTGRLATPGYALVFPLLCAVGGGLLLTHSHASLNLKSEFLIEVTHAPLGLFGIVVGWGRWLELRLAPGGDRLPARLWAFALTAVGVLLLIYRES
jgi:copper resistance protein D